MQDCYCQLHVWLGELRLLRFKLDSPRFRRMGLLVRSLKLVTFEIYPRVHVGYLGPTGFPTHLFYKVDPYPKPFHSYTVLCIYMDPFGLSAGEGRVQGLGFRVAKVSCLNSKYHPE